MKHVKFILKNTICYSPCVVFSLIYATCKLLVLNQFVSENCSDDQWASRDSRNPPPIFSSNKVGRAISARLHSVFHLIRCQFPVFCCAVARLSLVAIFQSNSRLSPVQSETRNLARPMRRFGEIWRDLTGLLISGLAPG